MPTYAPDDARLSSASLEFLASPAGLPLRIAIEQLPHPASPSVAEVAALRKVFPQDLLHAALTLAALQPKAREKFPNIPYVFATPEALEQATSAPVAHHKATRFARQNPTHIYDLCASIGGDCLALAAIAPTTAIDLSETRLTCLRLNAATQNPPPKLPVQTLKADIEKILSTLDKSALFHIDPARRSAGKRSPRYADLIPGPPLLEKVIAHFPGGTIKLSPATDFDSLPQGHLELVSHHRTVVQALLHTGTLASQFPPNTRTATVIAASADSWSYTATPATITQADVFMPTEPYDISFTRNNTLYELDGSLTRAQLAAPFAAEHHLAPLTSDGGYLLSNDPTLAQKLPCLNPFTVISVVPYTESRVKHELTLMPKYFPRIPHGPVEVKSRGHLRGIDNDALQIAFTKASPLALTILIFRHKDATYAAVATRPTPSTQPTRPIPHPPATEPRSS